MMIFGQERERRSRYNRHLQLYDLDMAPQNESWSSVSVVPDMEQLPDRIGYYQTTKAQSWRPIAYENIDTKPAPTKYLSNVLIEPSCAYNPTGISPGALKFPNLVSGYDRHSGHDARAALYTRYTPLEWTQGALRLFNEADTNKNSSERLRGDSVRVMRETEEKTAQGQRESGRRLGERVTDIMFWRNELRSELERLIAESNLLQDQHRAVLKATDDIEGPLHLTQECLYQREKREGIDLVHDIVEQSLIKEVNLYRKNQEKLKALASKIRDQMRDNRATQHDLEVDLKSKDSVLGIDNMCHQLNNFSKGINYYSGIEKYDPTICNTVIWAENSSRVIQRSQAQRGNSAQLRSEASNLINICATEVWDAWNNTNNALERRSSETLECKSKMQMQLHKVKQEIFDLEKYIELLKKSIMDKSQPMKVAHTRLEARTHRKKIELCRDNAQDRLMYEVKDLQDSIECLHRKLQESEAQHQVLLKTRSSLESDLHVKFNSLFIDRERCMGLRRSFPITAIIKY